MPMRWQESVKRNKRPRTRSSAVHMTWPVARSHLRPGLPRARALWTRVCTFGGSRHGTHRRLCSSAPAVSGRAQGPPAAVTAAPEQRRPRLRGQGSLRLRDHRLALDLHGRAFRAAAVPAEGWGGPWTAATRTPVAGRRCPHCRFLSVQLHAGADAVPEGKDEGDGADYQ